MYIKENVYFSSVDQETGEERLYCVNEILSEDEYQERLYNEYTNGVTRYDRTDNIKKLKDSDILAEKKRSNARSYVNAGKAGVLGSALGAGAGAVAALATRGNVRKAALAGGAIGGALAGGGKLLATHGEREENRFVNRRLGEAKRQALRRESRDWKTNTTSREGYTY